MKTGICGILKFKHTACTERHHTHQYDHHSRNTTLFPPRENAMLDECWMAHTLRHMSCLRSAAERLGRTVQSGV